MGFWGGMDVVPAGGFIGLWQPGVIPWVLPQVSLSSHLALCRAAATEGMILSRIYLSGGAWGGL